MTTSPTMTTSDDSQRQPPASGPGQEKPLPCPRCDSANTKFCYYNNYNASQPRHFCKSCRRYWTHGGTLRDIPIGGGSRKNAKRSRTWSSSYSTGFATSHELFPTGPSLVSLGPGFGGRSFTSMISGVHGQGFFGLGNGFVEGLGFGVEKWPFAEVNGGGGGATWQAESGGNGYVDNECFTTTTWPDLAICAPGQHGCLK